MLTAITGINWGDEGKGRMVDLISQEYDIVARYQGGNNAGHTVKNDLLPIQTLLLSGRSVTAKTYPTIFRQLSPVSDEAGC